MVQWKDATSYSYNDKERVPRIWETTIGAIRLSVHRYIGLDGWYLSTNPDICSTRTLKGETHEQASDTPDAQMVTGTGIGLRKSKHIVTI